MDKYEVDLIVTDDYGLFKNGMLVKVFNTRDEAIFERDRLIFLQKKRIKKGDVDI